MTRVKFHHDGREIERTIDDPSAAAGTVTMLAGFLDCEELIARWLESLAVIQERFRGKRPEDRTHVAECRARDPPGPASAGG